MERGAVGIARRIAARLIAEPFAHYDHLAPAVEDERAVDDLPAQPFVHAASGVVFDVRGQDARFVGEAIEERVVEESTYSVSARVGGDAEFDELEAVCEPRVCDFFGHDRAKRFVVELPPGGGVTVDVPDDLVAVECQKAPVVWIGGVALEAPADEVVVVVEDVAVKADGRLELRSVRNEGREANHAH